MKLSGLQRVVVGALTTALVSVGLVAVSSPPALAVVTPQCAGSLCDIGSVPIKKPPSWTKALKPYVYVKSNHHYWNHKLSKAALKIVTQARLDKLHRYWNAHRVPTSHPRTTSLNRYTTWVGSHGYVESRWYGLKVYVDPYLATKIIKGLVLTGAIAAALGLIPSAQISIAIAAALFVAAAALDLCRPADDSLTVYNWGFPFAPVPITFWGCKPWA